MRSPVQASKPKRVQHGAAWCYSLPLRKQGQVNDMWVKEAGATILRAFTATPLQPAVANIRRTELPSPSLFTRRIKSGPINGTDGFVDVRPLHEQAHGLLFLRTNYRAKAAGAGKIVYGADGPVRVWVNGAAVDCRPAATNPSVAGQYQAASRWKKGANDIVFALSTNNGAAWGIFAAAGKAGRPARKGAA